MVVVAKKIDVKVAQRSNVYYEWDSLRSLLETDVDVPFPKSKSVPGAETHRDSISQIEAKTNWIRTNYTSNIYLDD